MFAFTQSLPLQVRKPTGQGVRPSLCHRSVPVRHARLHSIARTRQMAQASASEGWATTRLMISTLPIDASKTKTSEGENLPGVHFESPPLMTIPDLLALIKQDTPDAWVNEIVRTFLGWRYEQETDSWDSSRVPEMWTQAYPDNPPDFIGKIDDYSPAIDRPIKLAVQRLARSVPPSYKSTLKPILKPHGFKGWKIEDLTPNRTRRATVVNWILYWYSVHYPHFQWS